MSNFDFMNNQDFLSYPTCRVLYENIILAEDAYFSDHEKCALKVRFVLEQFCIFVSEFKKANYPERIYMLGMYWNEKNRFEFIRIFHNNNVNLIREINAISCSFLHSEMPTREDIYPEMLKKVYYLMLWLYQELGFKTVLSNRDYSEDKIPVKQSSSEDKETDILYSSEKMLENFKKFFPNCNTERLCNVERKDDKFIITDLSGKQIDEMVVPEVLEYSEEQVKQLKMKLANKKTEFDAAKMEFLQIQSKQENRIGQLEEKIVKLTSDNERLSAEQNCRIKELKSEIAQLNRDKEETASAYKKKLNDIGTQFDTLHDKYEALLPVEEQRNILKQQVKSLLEERSALENNFLEKQNALLKEVANVKQRLGYAQNHIKEMNLSAKESHRLIDELENELDQKEKELLGTQDAVQRIFHKFQSESVEIVKVYQNKINDLEVIVTSLMAENMRFREMMVEHDYSEEVKGYLQIVDQGIVKINEGYALHKQNPNEQKLREYLLYVKNCYESQISELEEQLEQKNRELQEEKKKYDDLIQTLYKSKDEKEDQTGQTDRVIRPEIKRKKKKRIGKRVLAVSVLCALLCFGYLILGRKEAEKKKTVLVSERSENSMNDVAVEETVLIENIENTELNTPEIMISEEGADNLEEADSEMAEEIMPEATMTEETMPEEIIEEEQENDIRYSDDALNQLYQETVQMQAPDDYMMVDGINDKLLEEINNLDLLSVSVFGENTRRDDMYYIGRTKVPGMCKDGFSMHFMGKDAEHQLCNMNDNEIIKFAFVSGNRTGHIVVATEISDLSARLSRESTKEEVMAVLGDEITVTELEEPTIFANAEKETAVLFEFKKANGVIICFNEDGKICDYAYIGICNSK